MNFAKIRQNAMIMAHICQVQAQSPEVKELISNTNNKFDLIIMESMFRSSLGFSHVFNAPVILMSSLGGMFNNHHIIGSHTHPLIYPSPVHKRLYNLTMTEKIEELFTHYSREYAHYLNEDDENIIMQQSFGSTIPPLNKLYNNVDILFLNIHPIWADNQPVPPSVQYIGGIYQTPEKKLPEDLKSYLDSSLHGVIYLSFGTNVLSGMIPENKVQIIVKVLSGLPYNVLWKWDKDELLGKSDNIKLSKWYPQSDLLRHPKVKLFITQAGLQSTDEAIATGVPLIGIPMLADQWYNAEKYVKFGIGKKLDIETLKAEELRNAIENIIQDDSYRKNIRKLREIIRDQPEPPLRRAVWWTEYVLRHGGAKHLRPPTANITYAKYFEFEIVFVILLASALAILSFSVLAIFSIVYVVKMYIGLSKDKEKVKRN